MSDEDTSKDRFFERLGQLAEAMIAEWAARAGVSSSPNTAMKPSP